MLVTFGKLFQLLKKDNSQDIEGDFSRQRRRGAPEEAPHSLGLGRSLYPSDHIWVPARLKPLLEDLTGDPDASA